MIYTLKQFGFVKWHSSDKVLIPLDWLVKYSFSSTLILPESFEHGRIFMGFYRNLRVVDKLYFFVHIIYYYVFVQDKNVLCAIPNWRAASLADTVPS